MTTKHTPAPWNTTWSDDEPHRYVLGRGDMLIADCYADTAEDFGLPDPEEYQANAKLIAAAPELLDALQKIQTWWLTTPGFAEGEDDMPAEVFDAMRHAITKATGV